MGPSRYGHLGLLPAVCRPVLPDPTYAVMGEDSAVELAKVSRIPKAQAV